MKKTFREHSLRLRSRTGVSPVRGADELDAPLFPRNLYTMKTILSLLAVGLA